MTVTRGTSRGFLRLVLGSAFGLLVVRGTRPDADFYERLSAVMLLAALSTDSGRHHRELGRHHQALEAMARRQDRILGLLGEHRHE